MFEQKSRDLKLLLMNFNIRISHELEMPNMADVWPTENLWVILKHNLGGQKFQNIEEFRAGIGAAFRRISKYQTLHKVDAHCSLAPGN